MSTKNDIGWAEYLNAKGIALDGNPYDVEATELARLAKREARLLAKFDARSDLPASLAASGYTLLPTRNGRYLLAKGDLFIDVVPCTTLSPYVPRTPIPLLTAGRGSSESQFIDFAYISGILADFTSIPQMFQTIRGREYSTRFEFDFGARQVLVESVQIEVDSGYESLTSIVLVEAKIGHAGSFNLRQLYYPFRHFGTMFPTKKIRNIYLEYDIRTSRYSLYEFEFPKVKDPSSIVMKVCAAYQSPTTTLSGAHALIDVTFANDSSIVPQADDLNKVFELIEIVARGANTAQAVADYFGFDIRQSSYYREAAEFLGLLRSESRVYVVTPNGFRVLSAPLKDKPLLFAKGIVNSWLFAELIQRATRRGHFDYADIEEVILQAQNPDGSRRYSGSTVSRRRQTVVAWINWLTERFEAFSLAGPRISIR